MIAPRDSSYVSHDDPRLHAPTDWEYEFGIVVAGQNLRPGERETFLAAAEAAADHAAQNGIRVLIEVVDDSEQNGENFSKPHAINHGLKKLLPRCRVILQTDIDILIPPGAIEFTYKALMRTVGEPRCVWVVSRKLEGYKHGDPIDFKAWSEAERVEHRTNMSGCWMAFRVEDWYLIGGFNERIVGWGSDDWDLAGRAWWRGFRPIKSFDFPLMHIEHERRDYRSLRLFRRNESIIKRTPKARNFLLKRLPTILVLGAQKCGSSTAIDMLRKHPEVFVPQGAHDFGKTPEVHFFDYDEKWNYWGTDWYAQHFVSRHKHAAEKTPEYFHQTKCHARIKEAMPDCRLVVYLRDPVTRAYSALNHLRQLEQTWGGPFYPDDPIDVAMERVLKESPLCNMLRFGFYEEPLQSLFDTFDRSQIFIGIQEQITDMREEYARMFEFCGVDPYPAVQYKKTHVRRYELPMSDWARNELIDLYRDSKQRVYDLLGSEVPQWT